MDLHWGGGLEAGGDQDTEYLDGVDGTGTILTGGSILVVNRGLGVERTSSAPGARPFMGSLRLIESWWQPRIVTGPDLLPANLTITEN